MTSLVDQMFHNAVGLLFVIIAAGVLIGYLPIGRFRLGGSGVLLAGLIFGHYGFLLPKEFQTIGVVLFVYAIGLNAGPHIVESVKKSKGHFVLMALLIVSFAGGLTWIFRSVFGLPGDLISGIYAGAMTSTPALAAVMETLGGSQPSVGYGLAYPLGILGVVVLVQFLPLIFKVDLAAEEKRYFEELGVDRAIRRRSFRISNANLISVSVDDILARSKDDFRIARVRRGDRVFTPRPDDQLALNDVVLAVGTPHALAQLTILFGEPVEDAIPETENTQSRWALVSSKQFVGKKLGSLEIAHLYGVVITRIRRSRLEFVPRSNFVLEAGDEIRISGAPEDLGRFRVLVGRDRETVYETDIFSFALGLALGVWVGLIKIPIAGGLALGFGIAGGPLIVGLLMGYVGRFGRVTGHMPKAAKYVVGELGLYLFLATAGTAAGEHFISVLREEGSVLILCGFVITLVPILAAALVSRFVFRMNMLVILGLICGGMTSTPALGIISTNTKSDVPALAYTGIYPIAVLLTTLMAQILALF